MTRAYDVVAHGQPLEPRELALSHPVGREVLLKVRTCGVCHTDLHLWDGFYDLGDGERLDMSSRGIRLPMTLGHEIVGEVAAIGTEAQRVSLGDRRVIFPWIGCGTCLICSAGNGHLCLEPRTLGIFRPGGYAEHVLVPSPDYLFDFDGIPEAFAATLACSGITVYSALLKLGPPAAAGRPLFIGAGGLGLTAIQLAGAMGFAPPVIADVNPAKLEAVSHLRGVDVVDASLADAPHKIAGYTGGGATAAIDFVGSKASAQLGLDALRRGGKLIFVGLFGGRMSIPVPLMALRAISLIGSYVGSIQEFQRLIDLVKTGTVASIPTSTRSLAEATQALSDLREGKVVGRILLQP